MSEEKSKELLHLQGGDGEPIAPAGRIEKGPDVPQPDVLANIEEVQGATAAAACPSKADALELVSTSPWLYQYLPDAMKNDKDVAIEAVSGIGADYSFIFVPKHLQADREVAMAAVRRNGYALKYLSYEMQNDREVVMTAVRHNGGALQYASYPMTDDREVVMVAILQDPAALEYASERLQKDEELRAVALKGMNAIKELYNRPFKNQA